MAKLPRTPEDVINDFVDDEHRVIKTINEEDVTVWMPTSGYYLQLSFNRGEHRFVFSFDDARILAKRLHDASIEALRIANERCEK
jgi:hypothetical protein